MMLTESQTTRIYTNDPSGFALQNLFYVGLAGEYCNISDYHIEREQCDSLLVMHVLGGELQVQSQGNSCVAKSGSFVFLDCRLPHAYHAARPVSLRWAHLQGNAVFAYADLIRERIDNPGVTTASAVIRQEFEMLFGLLQSDNRLEHSVSIAVHRTLGVLAESSGGSMTTARQALIDAAAFLRQNYKKPISVADAAEVAHMSVYHFIRRFCKQHGVSPYEYLTMQRISCAKQQLLTTRKTTKQIALDCGFQSSSAFIHSFRTRTQMTPSQFRNMQL